MGDIQATCRDLLGKGIRFTCAKIASFNRHILGDSLRIYVAFKATTIWEIMGKMLLGTLLVVTDQELWNMIAETRESKRGGITDDYNNTAIP